MYSELLVFSQAVVGRDDEYNDWYTWVHIRDVMRLSRVVLAVQRFKRAAVQLEPSGPRRYPQGYFAIYETTDPARMTKDHRPVFSDDMPVSSAYAFEDICEAYYDVVGFRGSSAVCTKQTAVIIEQIESAAHEDEFVNWYLDTRLPALTRLPCVVSGSLGKASAHQMYDGAHPRFTALYRTTDLAKSVSAWRDYAASASIRDELSNSSVICFTPLLERLTAMQVFEPDALTSDTARRKREAMGDRVHRGAPGFNGFD
jgi:hypothetical protein